MSGDLKVSKLGLVCRHEEGNVLGQKELFISEIFIPHSQRMLHMVPFKY
jgi:hypothetical protein